MRPVLAAALVAAVLVVATAPQAQAALVNRPRPFHEQFGYMSGLGGEGAMTIVSGEAEADIVGGTSAYGFFDSDGLTVSGLQQVCYGTTCTQSQPSRPYSLVVAAATVDTDGTREGGSVALCFPSQSSGTWEAGHALALFVDLAQDDDLNSFPVDRSIVAPAVDGKFAYSSINAVATPVIGVGSLAQPCSGQAGLAALDDLTTVHVRNGQQLVTTLTGKDARFAFTGQPTVSEIQANFFILPFNGASSAHFDRASGKDARQGLDLELVQDVVRKLDQSHQRTEVEREEQSDTGNNTQEFLAGLLNGALLRLPDSPSENESLDLQGSHFVRFASLTVAGEGNGLDWDGKAYLEIKDGKVVGAKKLVGFWLFQLPWWSYLLWAAAITLAIVRLILKPDKNHPRWDALRWVGWVATPVAWVIVFILWDFEMRAVLGASLLHGSSGQFRLAIGLLQVGLLAIMSLAAAAPLRVIGRNSFLLAHQGTFMGVSGSIAAILGFLFSAPYLRAYVGVILDQVMDKLA